MPDHPLSGARLHSLIGDAMHNLPTHFIDTLERMLLANGMVRPAFWRAAPLRLVRSAEESAVASADPARMKATIAFDDSELSGGKRQALAAILEILHASHLSQHDGAADVLLGERLVEGLIVAGRELVREAVSADYPPG